MKTAYPRLKNLFVSALPEDVYRQLSADLEAVAIPFGEVIYPLNLAQAYVYFPETAVITVLTNFMDGSSVQTAMIGYEGIAGLANIFNQDSLYRVTKVQVGGSCLRIKAEVFKDKFINQKSINYRLLKYCFAFIDQISHNAACISCHKIERRFACWLLSLSDRIQSNEIIVTQEFIAQMMGVQRPTLSQLARRFQNQKIIEYVRGRLTILKREELEEIACECYEKLKTIYEHCYR